MIVGAGYLGKGLLSNVADSPLTGFKVLSLFNDNIKFRGQSINGYEVVGNLLNVDSFVEEHKVDEVWIVLPMRAEKRVKELLYALRYQTV